MSDPTVRPTILFLNVGHTFSHFFMLIFPTAVLALEDAWELSYAELLPLGFAGYLLFGLGALPAGWLGDRWSAGWMTALFFLGTGASAILTGLAGGPLGLAIGLTAIGLFASIYHPVGISWLVAASTRPGKVLGINGVFGAVGVGGAALVSGLLADGFGWRAAFILPGTVSLAVGAAFVLSLLGGRVGMPPAEYQGRSSTVGAAAARRGLFLLFVAILFAGLVFQMTSVAMPKIFQSRLGEVIGEGAAVAGLLVSIVYGVSALGQVGGGLLADRFDERWLYACSYGVQVVILSFAAITFDPTLVLMVALAATVQTGTQPAENMLIAKYTPDSWRGTVYGVKFVLAFGLSALGVPLVAMIYGATSAFTGVFLAMAAFSVVPILVGLMLPRSATGRSLPAPEPAE